MSLASPFFILALDSLNQENHEYVFKYHLDYTIEPNLIISNNQYIVELYRDEEIIGRVFSADQIEISESYYYSTYYEDPPHNTYVINVKIEGIDIENTLDIELY